MSHSTDEEVLDSDIDSLFSEPIIVGSEGDSTSSPILGGIAPYSAPARLVRPPIKGLYFRQNTLLPAELVELVMQKCIASYFRNAHVNQVMLFERADRAGQKEIDNTSHNSTLPLFLTDLLATLSLVLEPVIPPNVHALLFPPHDKAIHARQVIINHYRPGEGITPHVDLLDRFGDGIIGVSMGSGCAMRFRKVQYDDDLDLEYSGEDAQKQWDLYLPSGSVYVMTEEARYEWTHSIEKRVGDWVEDQVAKPDVVPTMGSERTPSTWIPRSVRVSITFRWLLPGADVVGAHGA